MNSLDDGTYEEEYKHINRTILDRNVMDMSLIIIEIYHGDFNADYSKCHGYYILRFSSSAYTLQPYLIIDGQVILLVKW